MVFGAEFFNWFGGAPLGSILGSVGSVGWWAGEIAVGEGISRSGLGRGEGRSSCVEMPGRWVVVWALFHLFIMWLACAVQHKWDDVVVVYCVMCFWTPSYLFVNFEHV